MDFKNYLEIASANIIGTADRPAQTAQIWYNSIQGTNYINQPLIRRVAKGLTNRVACAALRASHLARGPKKEIKIFGPIQPTRVGRSSSNISFLLFLLEKLGNVDNSTHPVS